MILDYLTIEERARFVVDKIFTPGHGLTGAQVVALQPTDEEWAEIIDQLKARYRTATQSTFSRDFGR